LLFAICYLLFAICYLLFAICYLLFAICYLLFAICYLLFAISLEGEKLNSASTMTARDTQAIKYTVDKSHDKKNMCERRGWIVRRAAGMSRAS